MLRQALKKFGLTALISAGKLAEFVDKALLDMQPQNTHPGIVIQPAGVLDVLQVGLQVDAARQIKDVADSHEAFIALEVGGGFQAEMAISQGEDILGARSERRGIVQADGAEAFDAGRVIGGFGKVNVTAAYKAVQAG